MTDFTYTTNFDPRSSWVDSIYYNANERYVVVDLNDEMYKYDDVDQFDVEALVDAPSTGAYFNEIFKKTFGPGEHLGHFHDVDFERERVKSDTTGTPKDLTSTNAPAFTLYGDGRVTIGSMNTAGQLTFSPLIGGDGPTREFSLGEPESEATSATITDAQIEYLENADLPQITPTREFSLGEPEPNGDDDDVYAKEPGPVVPAVVVHYSVRGDKVKNKFYSQTASNSDDAIEELLGLTNTLGLDVTVRKVVVKFE